MGYGGAIPSKARSIYTLIGCIHVQGCVVKERERYLHIYIVAGYIYTKDAYN